MTPEHKNSIRDHRSLIYFKPIMFCVMSYFWPHLLLPEKEI